MIKTPEDRQAGAEIEVTPEMIEAGVAALGKIALPPTFGAAAVLRDRRACLQS